MTETALLERFWARTWAGADRLDLLHEYADIVLTRPSSWELARRRHAHETAGTRAAGDQCFACRTLGRPMVVHHILQLQHGGPNDPQNLVEICELCHARVHPWLVPQLPVQGFESLRQIAGRALAWWLGEKAA